MNQTETVKFLAAANSERCYPKRLEEIKENLPYFEVKKNDYGKHVAVGYNYTGHDNEPRMEYVLDYLTSNIFPNIDKDCDIKGFYNIELHDACTYLNNNKDYNDCLVFAKSIKERGPVLLPDPYMMGNWGNSLMYVMDNVPWKNKVNKIVFCGTTTGNRDPLLNQRIKTCMWSLDKRYFCDFFITKIAQIEPQRLLKDIPGFEKIYRPPVSIPDQLKYRYHLVIDGNTSRFDIYPYKTKSLVLKYKSNDMLWYYPMLRKGMHYEEVDTNNIENVFNYYESNQNEVEHILFNANVFAENMFKPIVTQQYTVSLFENIAANK